MKRILVPCDFSINARQAYSFALDIAEKTGGEIFVLHAVDFPFAADSVSPAMPSYVSEENWKQLEVGARKQFQKMKDAHKTDAGVNLYIEFGTIAQTILKFIKAEKIDLVVMGTKGATGLTELMIGSNTEKIVRFSKVPVFAVSKATRLSSIKSIVLPTTLDLNQAAFIKKVKDLQKLFGAVLRLLVVRTPGFKKGTNDTRNALRDYAAHYEFKNFLCNVKDDENVEAGIVSFLRETQSDMIAMGTHSRKGLSHLLAGSITEDLVNHATCPIWTSTLKK